MGWVSILTLTMLSVGVKEIHSSADGMKYLASGFIKVLDECKLELNLSDHILTDLYNYWKQNYQALTRDTGCAIICMSKKLDLLDSSGKIHHGNAQEFAVKHGATDEIASQIVAKIHECEGQHAGEDECARVLEIAKCFRSGLHDLHWSPKVDVIVTEVLTEI